MTVQLKRLCEQRCVVLHFHPRPFARNVKEAGMLYLGAATGTFHGMYIAPERRGQGVMKHFFAYYVAFCRHCGSNSSRDVGRLYVEWELRAQGK